MRHDPEHAEPGLVHPEVAAALGRSVHATESLLARARRAFRTSYLEQRDG